MNIVSIYKKFPTDLDCVKCLESIRWNDKIACAYCKKFIPINIILTTIIP